jgi:hypothetical protein
MVAALESEETTLLFHVLDGALALGLPAKLEFTRQSTARASSAICFGWYVWEHSHAGSTIIDRI